MSNMKSSHYLICKKKRKNETSFLSKSFEKKGLWPFELIGHFWWGGGGKQKYVYTYVKKRLNWENY